MFDEIEDYYNSLKPLLVDIVFGEVSILLMLRSTLQPIWDFTIHSPWGPNVILLSNPYKECFFPFFNLYEISQNTLFGDLVSFPSPTLIKNASFPSPIDMRSHKTPSLAT